MTCPPHRRGSAGYMFFCVKVMCCFYGEPDKMIPCSTPKRPVVLMCVSMQNSWKEGKMTYTPERGLGRGEDSFFCETRSSPGGNSMLSCFSADCFFFGGGRNKLNTGGGPQGTHDIKEHDESAAGMILLLGTLWICHQWRCGQIHHVPKFLIIIVMYGMYATSGWRCNMKMQYSRVVCRPGTGNEAAGVHVLIINITSTFVVRSCFSACHARAIFSRPHPTPNKTACMHACNSCTWSHTNDGWPISCMLSLCPKGTEPYTNYSSNYIRSTPVVEIESEGTAQQRWWTRNVASYMHASLQPDNTNPARTYNHLPYSKKYFKTMGRGLSAK